MDVDFSNLKYRVDELKEGQDPFLVFHDFQKHAEFSENLPLPRKKVLKYIIYFYDPGSPILEIHKDAFRAKIKAAELAGFERNSENKFDGMVEQMIVCENPQINNAIAKYLIMTNDITWQKYHVVMQVYFRASFDLLSGEKDSLKALQDSEKELIATRNQITKRENSLKLVETLQRYYLEEKIELRPEERALRLSQNPNELPC
jgi:hypothetical protein